MLQQNCKFMLTMSTQALNQDKEEVDQVLGWLLSRESCSERTVGIMNHDGHHRVEKEAVGFSTLTNACCLAKPLQPSFWHRQQHQVNHLLRIM